MDLYIAEKPSLARTLAKHLSKGIPTVNKNGYIIGDGWVMTWCLGHLYELYDADEYNKQWGSPWNISALPIIPLQFKYRPVERTKSQLAIIHQLCSKATRVFNACDSDREGQYIFDLVIQHSSFSGPVFRVWPDDLSPLGLNKVFSKIKPNNDYRPLSLSAQCRSHADWLVGINFTRLFTCLAQKKGAQGTVSLGRVQTVAIALVYNRCQEIECFKSLSHFGLEVTFITPVGNYSSEWVIPSEFLNEQGYLIQRREAENVKSVIQTIDKGIIQSIEIREKLESSPLPYSLSKLQAHCSKKWGYSAKQVLNACQYLYEELKSLTYPRTDCGYLSEGDFKDAQHISKIIRSTINLDVIDDCDLNFISIPRCYNDSKTTAHTGIIPTSCAPDYSKYDSLSPKDKKAKSIGGKEVLVNIYTAVATRFIAQFMMQNKSSITTLLTNVDGYIFRTRAKDVTCIGWKCLESDKNTSSRKNSYLPIGISEETPITVDNANIIDRKTAPPEYFTEGSLILAMSNIAQHVDNPDIKKKLRETSGIGTEATRADIIERIKKIGYVRVDGKNLVITTLIRDLFPSFPSFFKTAAMTAIWESALQAIAEAKLDHNKFEANIVSWTNVQIKKLQDFPPEIILSLDDKYKCPACNSLLIKRKGKHGSFWACIGDCRPSFKDYKLAPLFPINGDGDQCTECQKSGREGVLKTRIRSENRSKGIPSKIFLGCDQYPACKHTRDDHE